MGIPFTEDMGFPITATMGNLFTMTLGIQLTISNSRVYSSKMAKIRSGLPSVVLATAKS
jgi:hypothetical protein